MQTKTIILNHKNTCGCIDYTDLQLISLIRCSIQPWIWQKRSGGGSSQTPCNPAQFNPTHKAVYVWTCTWTPLKFSEKLTGKNGQSSIQKFISSEQTRVNNVSF